jgi:hypothetical protein
MGQGASTAGAVPAHQLARTAAAAGLQLHAHGLAQSLADPAIAPHVHAAKQLYGRVLAAHGGFVGGAEGDKSSTIGADVIKEFKGRRREAADETKKELVVKLARALNDKSLGFTINESAPLEAVAKQIVEALPNPSQGRSFATDAATQKNICKAIAEALNRQFPQTGSKAKLIDTTASAPDMCRAVSDLMFALSTGICIEFLEIRASLEVTIRNAAVALELAKNFHGKGVAALEGSADENDTRRAAPFLEAAPRFMAELDRLLKQLEGLLHVTVAPAAAELEAAFQDMSGRTGEMLKDFAPGTAGFSDTLAFTLAGTGSLAGAAVKARAALAEVGLSLDQFAASTDWSAFDELLRKKEFSNPEQSAEEVGRFHRAVAELRKAFGREGLAKAMKEQAATGGAEPETELEKKEKRRVIERKLILKQYLLRSQRAYEKFLSAVKIVGPRLGREIPVTSKLDGLREALNRLNNDELPRLDLSLIGLYTSATARGHRAEYLSHLKHVRDSIDDIMAAEAYSAHAGIFRPIQEAIDTLVETIEFYSGVIAKKYGGTPGLLEDEGDVLAADTGSSFDSADDGWATPESGELAEAANVDFDDSTAVDQVAEGEIDEEEVTGGAEFDVTDLQLAERMRSSLDLQSAVNNFLYYFFVAKVQENLKGTVPELEKYGEKYDEVLGDAVAGRIKTIEDEFALVMDDSKPNDGTRIGPRPKLGEPMFEGALNDWGSIAAVNIGITLEEAQKDYDASAASLTLEHNTKKDFYRLLQAVDLYMKGFAQGIAADPEAVSDIKASLNGVNVLAKWFTEGTGDDLAKFFDSTQRYQSTPSAGVTVDPNRKVVGEVADDERHYYERVQAAPETVGTGGAFRASQVTETRAHVQRSLNNFQALKNLVNAFARLGARLGGKDLEKNVFMGSAEMYRIMIKFLRVSSVSTRIHAANPAVGNAAVKLDATLGGTNIRQAENAGEGSRVCFATPIADNGSLVSNWKLEHTFFQFIIKAIAAKVLVVVGVFDLLERPEPLTELTPTRMILGGSPTVEVISEATELYFRLPRLAEFYLDLFSFDADAAGARQDEKIAMLPEIDGIFGGLIAEIFVRSRASAAEGTYSEMECDGLIGAINKIYDHYRSRGDKATQTAIEDFIKEINRRYGIIKKADYMAILKRQEQMYQNVNNLDVDRASTNYAILPGEEVSYLGDDGVRRLAPADRYGHPGDTRKDVNFRPGRHNLSDPTDAQSMWSFLSTFRAELTKKLTASFSTNQISYNSLLQRARKEIGDEKEPRQRMEHVYQLIQGSSLISGSDQGRSLMFHETVVLGLNTLTGIHDILAAFRGRVDAMDVVDAEARFNKHMSTSPTANLATGTADGAGALAALVAAFGAAPAAKFDVIAYLRRDTATPADDSRKLSQDLAPYTPSTNNKRALDIWDHMRQTTGNDVVGPERNRKAAVRTLIDRPRIMRDMILNLFELTGDLGELVTLRFPGATTSKVHLDFSKLRDLVEGLMEDVRRFLNIFRPLMSQDVIRRFERDGRGSLQWLEENLMDGMIKGLTQEGGAPMAGNSLEDMSRKVNATMANLMAPHSERLNIPAAGNNVSLPTDPLAEDSNERYDHYGHVFSTLLFWDASNPNSGLPTATDLGQLTGLYKMPTDGEANVTPGAKTVGIPVAATAGAVAAAITAATPASTARTATVLTHRAPLFEQGGLTAHRSLMLMFNQLLANFVLQFYDPASGKIYQGLIDSFANGSFSQSVMENGYSQPDISFGATEFGSRGDPTGRSVLLSSVALLLRRLVKEQTSQGMSKFLVSSLAEVPLYIKEGYRASLPVYEKLFTQLGKQAEFLKALLQRANINCGRGNMTELTGMTAGNIIGAAGGTLNAAAAAVGVAGITPAEAEADRGIREFAVDAIKAGVTMLPVGVTAANTSDKLRPVFVDVIDAISSGCYTLSQTTQGVVRELADEPLYLQTSESSIQEFAARNNGKMPLMPLSLASYYLRDLANSDQNGATDNIEDKDLMPWHGSGSLPFKMLYGVRGLLGVKQQTSMPSMPGVKQLLADYNAGVQTRDRVEEGLYADFSQRSAIALRFLVDTRSYRSALVASKRTFGAATLFTGVAGVRQADDRLIYSLKGGRNLTQVIEVTDSTFREIKLKDMVADLATVDGGKSLSIDDRQAERVRSIIDMNIPPINVHALMRTMALANLYNYGYTFEEMAAKYYNSTRDEVSNLKLDVPQGDRVGPKSTRGFFLKMLQDPFAPISDTQYGVDPTIRRNTAAFFGRLCRGDNDLAMGRPKFISDQLYNKVLFGSLYPATNDRDEGGPSGAISRGRDDWGGDTPAHNLYGFLPTFNELHGFLADTGQGRLHRNSTNGFTSVELDTVIGDAITAAGVFAGFTDVGDALPDYPTSNPAAPAVPVVVYGSAILAINADAALPGPAGAPAAAMLVAYTGLAAAAGDIAAAGADEIGSALQVIRELLTNMSAVPIGGVTNTTFFGRFDNASTTPATRINTALTAREQINVYHTLTADGIRALDGGTMDVLRNAAAAFDPRFLLMLLGAHTAAELPGGAAATPPAEEIRLAVTKAVFGFIDAQPEVVAVRQAMNVFVRAIYAARPLPLVNGRTGFDPDPRRGTAQMGDASNVLTYIGPGADDTTDKVRAVAVGPAKEALLRVGKNRFDTALVRSLFFIVNVWRLTRAKLSYELAQQRTVIEQGEALVAPEMTEFGTDPRLGVNETVADRQYFSERTI